MAKKRPPNERAPRPNPDPGRRPMGPGDNPPGTAKPGYYWARDENGDWVEVAVDTQIPSSDETGVTGGTGQTGTTGTTGSTGSTGNTPAGPFSASELLESVIFAATGIRGLGPWAGNLWNQGATATEILQALRYGTDTSDAGKSAYAAYLAAFPMMDTFLREGIFAGESPELDYINYRNTVKDAAQRFGINDNLVTNEKIAGYISNRNSASEIVDRMNLAATAVATTPAETMTILREYYGVNNGDLVSFYLDPDETEAMLTKRYTAARLGTEAARQRFGVSRTEAEALAERGVTVNQAEQGFAQAAAQTAFMQGFGETATREDILGAAFGGQAEAEKVTRIAGSRIGRFQEGGGFAAGQQGVSGLGTSTTR